MSPFRHAAALLFAGYVSIAPAAAQTEELTLESLTEFLAGMAAEPDVLREELTEYLGVLPDPVWNVIAPRVASYMGDPAFAAYLFDRAAPAVAAATTEAELVELSATIQQAAAVRGILRLDAKHQELFLRVAQDIIAWAAASDPAVCTTMLGLTPDDAVEAAGIEYRFLAEQTPGYVDQYYEVIVMALLAEVHDDPPPRNAGSGAAATEAMAAYESTLLAMIDALPDPTRFYGAILGGAGDDPTATCTFADMTFEAIWELPERHRSNVVLTVLTEMRDAY